MLGNAIARRWAPQNGHERREFSRLFGPRTARPPPPRFGPKTPKNARSARARSHENFGDKTLANFFFSAPTFFTRICRANFFFSVFFFASTRIQTQKRKNFLGAFGAENPTCIRRKYFGASVLAARLRAQVLTKTLHQRTRILVARCARSSNARASHFSSLAIARSSKCVFFSATL